ncbi:MAG TPA: CBS domain-containing protein [Candidatus Acidoferrum sp.]|nr:CBS domain-containing protein [Candidatus Acidoferrum sp.]
MDASHINIPKELISKTESFDASTPISKVLSAVDKYGAVVVNKSNQYYGIIDNRSLYNSRISAGKRESAGKFASVLPAINDSTSVDEMMLGFHKSRAKALPYSSGRRITGVIKRFTLLKILLSLNLLSDVAVSEAMTAPVLAVDASASISQARAAMREGKVSRLVVLQNRKLFGIITNHDILYNHSKTEERLPEMKSRPYGSTSADISAIANNNLVIVDYSKSLADVARAMVERDVSSVIVTRKGNPVGIITVYDIFGSMLAKRNIEDQKIFISGLDDNTREYEDEIRDSLKAFMKKAEKIHGASTPYMTVNIKKGHGKTYEMHARLSLGGRGTLYVHASDYSMERTVNRLLSKLMSETKRMKEMSQSIRKISTFKEGMDEAADYE